MRTRRDSWLRAWIVAALVAPLLNACDRAEPTALPVAAALPQAVGVPNTSQIIGVARCAPSAGGFTATFTHPYFFPPVVGRQSILVGDEAGEHITLKITILAQTRNVGGVTTRVIEEREFADGVLREVSWNYYAQASDGSICYFGEDVDIYQAGGIVHTSAWCGVGGNQPGVFLPAETESGVRFKMEFAPGVAEDEGEIVGSGPVTVPFGRIAATVRVREFNPLDGDKGFKVYGQGYGLIVDGPVELTAINQTSGIPQSPTLTLQACGV